MTPTARRYLPEEEQFVRQALETGTPVEHIAKALRRSENSVWLLMSRCGIRVVKRRVRPELARDIAAVHARDPSLSDRQVAAAVGCHPSTVHSVLELPCSLFRRLYQTDHEDDARARRGLA